MAWQTTEGFARSHVRPDVWTFVVSVFLIWRGRGGSEATGRKRAYRDTKRFFYTGTPPPAGGGSYPSLLFIDPFFVLAGIVFLAKFLISYPPRVCVKQKRVEEELSYEKQEIGSLD